MLGSGGTPGAPPGGSTFPGSVSKPCQENPMEAEWDEVFQVQRWKMGWDTRPQARESQEQQLPPPSLRQGQENRCMVL